MSRLGHNQTIGAIAHSVLSPDLDHSASGSGLRKARSLGERKVKTKAYYCLPLVLMERILSANSVLDETLDLRSGIILNAAQECQGMTTATPLARKSLTFLVTTVMP